MPVYARPKVLVAMSGGVDSSVAAALLLDRGYDVVGCFMRLGGEDRAEPAEAACAADGEAPAGGRAGRQGCCSVNDAADARLVAARLGIPFYVLNFKADFGRVIDYFVAEYHAGRTPNPCVRCNDWLKFGKLAAYADSIDAAFIATGHYARIGPSPGPGGEGRPRLLRGLDARKDQSYVLFGTRPATLARMLLPIGEMEKPAVRAFAEARGLPVFDKPDSQEICFVPDQDYAGFVRRRSPGAMREGELRHRDGRVLGRHGGHQGFTIGQRRGLGVATGVPLYVLDRDAATNTVTVGDKEDLLADGLRADSANWLIDPGPLPPATADEEAESFRPCQIKVRYNSPPVPGRFRPRGPAGFEARFDHPQSAITPGQAAVLYDGDAVLGGGWIAEALRGEPSIDRE